jgi:phosphoenolpyruvate synthase/pyruvate phosphate dikinase
VHSLCLSQVQKAAGTKVDFKIGTMIEVPRGALIAGTLAKTAEFFSFGTNDLTQMTFGISRDDAQVRCKKGCLRIWGWSRGGGVNMRLDGCRDCSVGTAWAQMIGLACHLRHQP